MATQPKEPNRAEEHDVAVDSDERPFLDHIIELRERLLKSLLAEIQPLVRDETLFVSIAAGVTLETLQAGLGATAPSTRCRSTERPRLSRTEPTG